VARPGVFELRAKRSFPQTQNQAHFDGFRSRSVRTFLANSADCM
jgi:hypothetical protein